MRDVAVGQRRKAPAALRAFLVAMLGLCLNQIIGALWLHPRPFAIGLGHTWVQHVADSSFPSDHMTLFAAVGLSLLLGRERLVGSLTLGLAVAVAWARIFLGLHFPPDMLGVACVSYVILSPLWRGMGERLTGFIEQLYRRLMAWPIGAGWVRQ